MNDSGRAPDASAKRQTSAKMWPAAAPAALSPCASVAPAASAAAFFATPGELDADRVVRQLADDSGAGEDAGEALGEALVERRGDEPGAGVDHLLGVRGAADARDAVRRRSAPRSSAVGAAPSGGTSPFDSDTTDARRPRPAEPSASIAAASRVDGTARKT